jgi:glycosyltransferase involved in cell wall biosynthesis
MNAKINNLKQDKFCIAYFVGDLKSDNKNYKILPLIDKLLIERGVEVDWLIAGDGFTLEENYLFWPVSARNRVEFWGFLDESRINDFLSKSHAMILPSKNEGLPVSVVEAMKRGVVPFIPFWDGAVIELVKDRMTGFYIDDITPENFANEIFAYYWDVDSRKVIPQAAKLQADTIFNPIQSVLQFESEIVKLRPKTISKYKSYGSRLDNMYIPNFIVKALRSILG